MDNPNDNEDDCKVEVESDIKPDNGIEDQESPEQQYVSATPNVPRLIQPTQRSRIPAAKVLVMVNAIETRRKMEFKTTYD